MKGIELFGSHPSDYEGTPIHEDRSAQEHRQDEVELTDEEVVLSDEVIIVEAFEPAENGHH